MAARIVTFVTVEKSQPGKGLGAMEDGASPRVSVVIPALNEASNIAFVLATVPADVYEVVLVDGGSDDGTADVARSVLPTIRVVQQPGRGKGDALVAGMSVCRGDVI